MSTKTCTKCHEVKDAPLFSKQAGMADGLKAQCKACDKEYARAYYERNKEAIQERTGNYQRENPEKVRRYAKKYADVRREALREKSRQYRIANAGRIKKYRQALREQRADVLNERSRLWNERNSERVAATCAAWAKRYPERRATKERNRRAAKVRSGGTHTHAEIKALLVTQNGQCGYCRVDITNGYHADHIIPLKLGGSNAIGNIQLLCPRCNLSKGAMHPGVFMRKRGSHIQEIPKCL